MDPTKRGHRCSGMVWSPSACQGLRTEAGMKQPFQYLAGSGPISSRGLYRHTASICTVIPCCPKPR
eukprot:4227613-Pyramimonas_sp.AAC.1